MTSVFVYFCPLLSAFPQLKEISFKMTITLEGGSVLIKYNYNTIFLKVLRLSLCQILSPYQDSHMQKNVETLFITSETKHVIRNLTRDIIVTLKVLIDMPK